MIKSIQALTFFLVLFILTSCQTTLPLKSPQQGLSVMQGATTNTTSHFVILHPLKKYKSPFTYKIIPPSTQDPKPSLIKKTIELKNTYWQVDRLSVTNLIIHKQYVLQIWHKDQLLDTRTFNSVDLNKENVSIATASCADDKKEHLQKQMWQELLSHKPDYLFLLGDNLYADKHPIFKGPANPYVLMSRYIINRQNQELYKAKHLTPILAIWDDHDYGKNGGGSDYKFKKESKYIFDTFFAQDDIKNILQNGPGVSFHFKAFKQNFLFIDNRYFRSPTSTPKAKRSQWGKQQELWAFKHLKANKSLTWLIQGDQYFGAYHRFESFEKLAPNSFKQLLTKVNKAPAPVFFLSGDMHLTELMKITKPDLNYTTYEFTSSSIHGNTYPEPWSKSPNPRQIAGKASINNYGLIKFNSHQIPVQFDLTSYGPGKIVLFNKKLTLKK